MKTIFLNTLICWLIVMSLVSCNMSSSRNKLPPAQGRAGEVLIVMNDYYWKNACGDSIRRYLTEPVRGLPAPEPMFTLSQKDALIHFLQKMRNVLIINIDTGYEGVKLGYKTDVYAQGQLIFNLDASSPDSAIAGIRRNKDLIIAAFLAKDRDATIADYKKNMEKTMIEQLREKFQVDIVIPKSYSIDVEKDDFVWIVREEGERNWYILMWKDSYFRTSQLETDSLIFKMNAMTRKYVPGPTPGSYMADEPMVIPTVKRFEKDGIYCVQINGLWQTENSYMGGPYVNHTIVDVKRGQIVTGIGFVFYPNRDKRNMVRQLESILYTMQPVTELSSVD